MDRIYSKSSKSDFFSIKDHFENYKKQLENLNEFEESIDPSLENEIDIEHLSTLADTRILKSTPQMNRGKKFVEKDLPPEALQLKCITKYNELKNLNLSQRHIQIFEDNPIHKKQYRIEFDRESMLNGDLEQFSDVAITIRVYEPSLFKRADITNYKPQYQQEFICLGQNYLTELRDKINCVCKDVNFFDISDNPLEPQPKKKSDSNFLFITDTFYNDYRNPNNIDYSEHFMKWSENCSDLKGTKFKEADMSATKFIDLSVYLGFPQLYLHHGNCEHLVVFSHIALLDSTFSLRKSDYPFLRSSRIKYNNICIICNNEEFAFMVLDSDAHVQNPTNLCKKCFMSYHYSEGKKIGNFRAYRISE